MRCNTFFVTLLTATFPAFLAPPHGAQAQVITLHGHTGAVTSGTFSPDGKLVRTTGDESLRTWNATSGVMLDSIFFTAIDGIGNVMYSADGSRYALAYFVPDVQNGNDDEIIPVYDSLNNPVNVISYTTLDSYQFLLSPDGSMIVMQTSEIPEDEVGTKYVANGDWVAYLHQAIGPLAITQNGKIIAYPGYSAALNQSYLLLGALDSEKVIDTIYDNALAYSTIYSMFFNSSGTKIIVNNAGRVEIWDRTSATLLDTLPILLYKYDYHSTAFFSPNDSLILTVNGDSTATIWDANTYAPLHVLRAAGTDMSSIYIPGFGNSTTPSAAAFSPDGTRILTVHSDTAVRVWNAQTGALLHTLKGHTAPITSVSWDHTGSRILTTSADGTAKIWDRRTRR